MEHIIFKREFSVLFDAVKTENVPYLKEKIELIKKIVIKKSRKNHLKFEFQEIQIDFRKNLLLHIKFGISRTSRLRTNQFHRQTLCFIIIRHNIFEEL